MSYLLLNERLKGCRSLAQSHLVVTLNCLVKWGHYSEKCFNGLTIIPIWYTGPWSKGRPHSVCSYCWWKNMAGISQLPINSQHHYNSCLYGQASWNNAAARTEPTPTFKILHIPEESTATFMGRRKTLVLLLFTINLYDLLLCETFKCNIGTEHESNLKKQSFFRFPKHFSGCKHLNVKNSPFNFSIRIYFSYQSSKTH